MSLAVKAKIIGMPKLLQKLKVIPDVARAEIRIEMARQADEIVAMMKSLVPKDSHALEKSIGWTWGGKVPKGAMAIATGGKGDLTITIYAGNDEAWYARFVEFGTRAHTAGGKFAGAEILHRDNLPAVAVIDLQRAAALFITVGITEIGAVVAQNAVS